MLFEETIEVAGIPEIYEEWELWRDRLITPDVFEAAAAQELYHNPVSCGRPSRRELAEAALDAFNRWNCPDGTHEIRFSDRPDYEETHATLSRRLEDAARREENRASCRGFEEKLAEAEASVEAEVELFREEVRQRALRELESWRKHRQQETRQ